LLAYASAYLKVYYLAEYTTAMLNNFPLGFYSPATLIKDAQRHGLHFRHVDVNRSDHFFTIEDGEVRMGLKYVKGLRKEVAEAIVQGRNPTCREGAESGEFGMRNSESSDSNHSPFTSVEDLVRRVPLINKKEIRALSLAGALNFERSVHRREALWRSELAIRPDVFSEQRTADNEHVSEDVAAAGFIRPMTEWQAMESDLRSMAVTIGRHPMAFLREGLKKRGVLSAIETHTLQKKDVVTVAGTVIVRQRPSTANSVVFITMEDETGHSNFIVMPDIFERFRRVITHNSFLLIKGIAEEGGMIKALYFEPIGGVMAEIGSHDFH